MTIREIPRKPIQVKELLKHQALESDTSLEIREPCQIYIDGKLAIIYGKLPTEHSDLNWTCKTIRYDEGVRDTGLVTYSRIFGFCPRIALRGHNYCSSAALAYSQSEQHNVLINWGRKISTVYQALAPEHYQRQLSLLSSIRPEWRVSETPFTSGIVNKNNPLKYHFDGGNFDDVMSCMIVLRKNCTGGMLSVPEIDARFALEDGSYFLFDGQKILHGVTPIKLQNKTGYRYSVVYYALKAMARCGSPEEELFQARHSRLGVERRRSTASQSESVPSDKKTTT